MTILQKAALEAQTHLNQHPELSKSEVASRAQTFWGLTDQETQHLEGWLERFNPVEIDPNEPEVSSEQLQETMRSFAQAMIDSAHTAGIFSSDFRTAK